MRLPLGFAFALICSLTRSGSAIEPLQVRVLSYNIHHGEGTDGKLDLERIAKVIASVAPDVVALQEVDYATGRTERVDQAVELAKWTGMSVAPGDNIDVQGGRYGNAVLSRWRIGRHENHPLPVLTGGEQRGALEVEIDPGDGRPEFTLFCTHLDHRPGDEERLAAAKVINGLVSESDEPALLVGDLNAEPTSEPLKAFGAAWENPTAAAPLFTIPAAMPRRQIDFVLHRPAGRWRAVEAKVLDEPVASDHRPLLVVLELSPE